MGKIVPLTDIWQAVQLIPVFGKKCPAEWTCDTAVELAKQFFVNCYACKQTYQSVYYVDAGNGAEPQQRMLQAAS